MSHPELMEWESGLAIGLSAAIDESTVCGFRYDRVRETARLLLEVMSLPEIGPIDSDFRRVLVMSGVSSAAVWLQPLISEPMDVGPSGNPEYDAMTSGRTFEDRYGPAMPFESFETVEEIFGSAQYVHANYGSQFIDFDDPWDHLDTTPSIEVSTDRPGAAHVLRWFAELGLKQPGQRENDDGIERASIAGVVRFDDLTVERADGVEISLPQFAADGVRWWDQFFARDERTSTSAQRTATERGVFWRNR